MSKKRNGLTRLGPYWKITNAVHYAQKEQWGIPKFEYTLKKSNGKFPSPYIAVRKNRGKSPSSLITVKKNNGESPITGKSILLVIKKFLKSSSVLGLVLVLGFALSNHAQSLEDILDQVSNFTSKASVSIVIAGDTGAKDFAEVASAIVEHCGSEACHFAVLLGDNFYLRPFGQGPASHKSHAFSSRFYEPLAELGTGFDVWAVLGNHGYLLWARPEAQIEHTYDPEGRGRSSPDWLLPDHMYKIPKLPRWLEIVGFDSQLVLEESEERDAHLSRIREAYGESDSWRILVGHHPFHTSGKHGEADRDEQEELWAHMGVLVEDLKIQWVLSGHDHDVEFIETPGFIQVVQGGGSKLRDEVRRDPLERGARCRFFSNRHSGFGKLTVTEEQAQIEYFGVANGVTSMTRSFTCVRHQSGVSCIQSSHQGEASGCPSGAP